MKPNCVDCYTKYFPLQLLHSQQLRFSAPPPPALHPSISEFAAFWKGGGGVFFCGSFSLVTQLQTNVLEIRRNRSEK